MDIYGKFLENYKYMNIIHKFITELNMKEDEVYEKPYIWMLRWLDYFNERSAAENHLRKQQEKQNKMKAK